MALTTTVITEKGGAGKTTVTLGLASAAMATGRHVLVVDMDPQGSATHWLGIEADQAAGAMVRALDAAKPGGARDELLVSTWAEHVHVLPAARDLRDWAATGNAKTRRTKLARALKGVADAYPLVLVDAPPTLNDLAVNALAAADRALLVTEPSALGISAIEPTADLVDELWHSVNPGIDLAGVIVNRMPAWSNEADRQYDELGRIVGRRSVWKPTVPQRVLLNQAAGERRPIHDYGFRGAELADIFDKLHRKLMKTA